MTILLKCSDAERSPCWSYDTPTAEGGHIADPRSSCIAQTEGAGALASHREEQDTYCCCPMRD